MPIHGNHITIFYPAGDIRHPGDAGNPVFPGDNGAVNQHAAATFHNGRTEGNHIGHVGVHGIAYQYFPRFEMGQIFQKILLVGYASDLKDPKKVSEKDLKNCMDDASIGVNIGD